MKMVPLGEVAQWGSGGTPKRSVAQYFGPGIPWLSIADLTDGPISAAKESLTPSGIANSAAKVVPPGTILVAMYGSIGKLGITEAEMATSQAIAFAIPNETVIDRRYFFHFLLSERPRLQARGRGGTQSNIGQSDLKAWKIPLPHLNEQRRIAAILDHADNLRTKRRQALAHLDALPQAIFREMFGDEPATADVTQIAAPGKGTIRTGPFGSQLLHSEFVDHGISVLGLDNVVGNQFTWGERRFITPEKYRSLTRYTVHPGDVLISIMGTTGRCVVVPDDIPTAINTKHICAITPDSMLINPHFLRAAFLWHPESRAHLRRQTKGSIMDGLNMGIIKTMPIPVPSISRQREFETRITTIESQRNAVMQSSRNLNELFTSLQSRAFKGEL